MQNTKRTLLPFLALLFLFSSLSAQEEVFRVVEQMPEYPGCEDVSNADQRRDCAVNKLLAYIGDNLQYPQSAKDAELEGTVIVAFVVEKDGSLSDIKTLRDIGQGCGDAAKAVIEKMNTENIKWNSGKQRGRPVRVRFNLPVKFSLQPRIISIEEEIMEDVIEEDGEVMIEMDYAEEAPPRMREASPPPPPPPPPPPVEEIFKVVEDMPRFPDSECEAISTTRGKEECAQKKLLEYIYGNLNYPAIAKENGVEGMVVVSFTVQENGILKDIKILRDIGAGCGTEAQRVIEKMNTDGLKWIPGKQRGRAVSVMFNLPVRFKLPEAIEEEVTEEEIIEEEAPMVEEVIEIAPAPEVAYEAPPPPPPPPPMPANPEVEEVFKIVEQMPRFPGCEDFSSSQERKNCAQEEMLKYIYKNLSYPQEARTNGIEGTVVVTFVVEKNGTLGDIRLIRDIGGGCGDAAVRVIELMNEESIRWIPGKQRGRAVRVQWNMPVKFRL